MTLRRLEADDIEMALDLIVDSFVSGSVLHAALGVDVETYRRYADRWLGSAVSQGLSWIAVDDSTDQPAGCLLAVDYEAPADGYDSSPDVTVPEILRPMTALLAELEAAYAEIRGDDRRVVLVDLAVVSHAFRGRRVYRRLREALHRDAPDKGFTHVVGELSSAATQRVCIDHFGHRVVAEVAYESFEFEGRRPFASITTPPTICMVEGELISGRAQRSSSGTTGWKPAGSHPG